MSDQSQIKMTPELEKAILEATSVSAISSLMRDAAIEQHLVQESDDPFFLKSVAPGTAERAKKEVRIVNLNNKKYYIEAESGDTASLDRQEADLFRKIFAEAPAASNQRRDANGKFVSDADAEAARQAEAQAAAAAEETVQEKFEREMVEKALARQGISIDTLREIEADKQAKADAATWESAAEEFRTSRLGADWPGGEKNKQTMGAVIAELGLTDKPSVDTLTKAYLWMKQNNQVAPNEEFEREKSIASATDYESIKRYVGYRGDSGMFGH
jgi:hypothetical protein